MKKKYEIASNKDFLEWLENAVKNGYHFYNKIDELQQLVDRIVNWYEIKYPEWEFEYFEGTRYIELQYPKKCQIQWILNNYCLEFQMNN